MSQVKLLFLATNGRGAPTCAIAGLPSISYFMLSLRAVLRLQPHKDRVYIVANELNYHELQAWAASKMSDDFPAVNILNTGRTDVSCDVAADVAFAVETAHLQDSHLVISSLDVMYQPYVNLQRIVEHAMIRGKDTVVFTRPPPGQDVSTLALLNLDDMSLGVPNPRVVAAEPSPSGTADGIMAAALSPMMIIRRTTLPDLFLCGPAASEAQHGSTHASCQVKQLAALIQERLLSEGKPVYALEEDFCLDTSTPAGVEAADAVYGMLAKPGHGDTSSGAGGPAAQALMEVTEAARSLGIVSRGDERIEDLLATCSPAKKAYLGFFASNWKPARTEVAEGQSASLRSTASRADPGTLPERFADPMTRRHNPRLQHPVYQTSNNDYGLKRASGVEMPDTYNGSSQFFSGTFYGGPSKVSCMLTAVTTSKVHRQLNDY